MKLETLNIGNIKLASPLLLAPMVDVTNLPYRLICRKAGASLCYTEMIYTSAILHDNRHTLGMLKTVSRDHPLGLQITGNNLEEFKQLLPFLNSKQSRKSYNLIDLNCGCPSDKILGNQAGAFLLNDPKKIANIIKLLKSHDLTVTAKIRLGYKTNNVLKIAKIIEKSGADALTLHPRLATQGYDSPADYSKLKLIKRSIGIPLIGNGDVLSEEKAQEILSICDGAMIARGAIGDPLIFSRINHYLKTGKKKPFNFKQNIKSFQDYLSLSKKHDLINIASIRHVGSKFIRNIEGAAKLRDQLMHLNDLDQIQDFIKNL